MTAPRTIGLALGGGAARGWAHLGVLQALAELAVPIHCAAGTSMGALVGGFCAAGRLPALAALALQLDRQQALRLFLEPGRLRAGLLDGRKIMDFVRQHIGVADIEALPMPYRAVATDLLTGQEVVLARGDLTAAIRASIAIPGMFTPVPRANALLADGGLVNPLPVSVARALGATAVIAVDLNHYPPAGAREKQGAPADAPSRRWQPTARWITPALARKVNAQLERLQRKRLAVVRSWNDARRQPTIFDVIGHSIRIMEAQITAVRLQLEPPDVLIRPDLRRMGYMEFHRAAVAMEAGYRATMAQKPALLKLSAG